MRKTIYVKDEVTWARVIEIAKERGISISSLLLSNFENPGKDIGQLDRIEGILSDIQMRMTDSEKGEFLEPLVDDIPKREVGVESKKTEAQIIAEGQANLDAIRADRDIKTDKIQKVKEKVESVTGFSGGYSKDYQARKKGK